MALARLETTLPEDVLGDIANRLLGQKSPLYDDGDLARDAVSLLLVAKATPLKDIGLQLCSLLSPYLGKTSVDGVTAKSKAPAIKAKLKELGQPHIGNKPELVQRLYDLMEGATPHSPVSNALRARTLHLKEVRITDSAAKKLFDFQPSKTPSLRESGVQEASGNHFGGGYTVTYRLHDVKAKARMMYSSYDKLLKQRNRTAEFLQGLRTRREDARTSLQAELQRRGVAAQSAARALDRLWDHPFFYGGGNGLAAAATEFEEDIFLTGLPSFPLRYLDVRRGYVFSKKSKSKQTKRLIERAQELALADWVRGFASRDQALAFPGLPPGLRPRVTRASLTLAPAAPAAVAAPAAAAAAVGPSMAGPLGAGLSATAGLFALGGPCPDCGGFHQAEGECAESDGEELY